MHAARSFLPPGADAPPFSGTALAFGFLLLVAFFAGKIFATLRLPRLTGYIVTGIIAGPSVLGLVSREMLRSLGPVQGVAICLIALTAGGELNLKRMRPYARVVTWMMACVVGGCAVLCTTALYLLRPWLPFLDGLTLQQSFAVCSIIGVSLAAMSPAVVMALLTEMRAEGSFSRTVLGVVVAADLLVIVLFGLVAAAAQAVLSGTADVAAAALHVAWELFGSAGAGVVMGVLLALYLRKVRASRSLFVLLVCVVMAEVGSRLALDPLLVALSAGLFMENFSEVETTALVHEIEAASLPVFVVFFAVAGAALRLDVLALVAMPAAVLVLVRALAIWGGTRVSSSIAHAEPRIARWSFAAFLPQAGLALALPLLYPKVLPGLAEGPAALVLGIVGINQVLTPVLLRIALIRTGEANQAHALTSLDQSEGDSEERRSPRPALPG
nr:MAG: sodium:proton exchanger [Pseudomonadota bacterium]